MGALSVVLILALGLPLGALACPHPCACYVPTEVHCTFRSLAAVPARISKHVERINFGFVLQFIANSFTFLVWNPGMFRTHAAFQDLCVHFLSRIADCCYFQTLYFKHCNYRHEGNFSVSSMFKKKSFFFLISIFMVLSFLRCHFLLTNSTCILQCLKTVLIKSGIFAKCCYT